MEHYIEDMEILADVMANQKNWDLPQVRLLSPGSFPTVSSPVYAILKEMHTDPKRLHYSYQHNR